MILPLLFMLIVAADAPRMRVCFGKDCSLVEDADIACPADGSGQQFAAIRPAVHQIDAGVCGSDEVLIARAIDPVVDRPQETTMIDLSIGTRWLVTLTATELAQIRRIRAPAGELKVALQASHYRGVAADLKNDRTTLVLRRNPVIRGRVLSASAQPLMAATIQPLPDGSPCFTRVDGSFDCEIERDWPRSIAISRPNAATHIIAIDRLERDADLGSIRLSRGAGLSVKVRVPEGVRVVDLMLSRGDVPIARRKVLFPFTAPVSFSDLEPGSARLLIKGSRPFQQRTADVTIKDGDNDQAVSIEESELTLSVDSGGRSEPGASIVLKNLDGGWSGTSETDGSGAAVEPLWQLGTFTASVRARNSASPVLDHRELSGGAKQQWTFHLPIGRIEGVVRNDDEEGVSNADVSLTTDDGDSTIALHTKADAGGRYAFDGVRPGAQAVAASADGYLPSDASQFPLVESENLRRVDIRLHRGALANLEIVDGHGVPIAGATVVAALGNAITNRVLSDAAGRAALQLPASGSPVVFVVPASGSFATHRVTPIDRDQPSIRITVPDPAASLELKTVTTDQQPVRDVHFLVRYDGETIPFDLLIELAQRFGVDFKTGADGSGTLVNLPSGFYELWPYEKAAEVDQVIAGIEAPAPLRIALIAGPNAVTLTFRAKRH